MPSNALLDISPLIFAPGALRWINTHAMLSYGVRIREELLWQHPLLSGAVTVYMQLASNREVRVSGPVRGASRCVEWLNKAQTRTYDGLIHRGFSDYISRRSLDNLTVGRTIFHAEPNGPLEYLDPAMTFFNANTNKWENSQFGEEYPADQVVVHHPIPIGGSGNFISPLAFIMPTAALAWLVREHDRSALDGRKIRDIIIARGQETVQQIVSAIEQMITLYTSAAPPDPTAKSNIPVVYVEDGGEMPVKDMIHRLGISHIPESFDRAAFEFEYVNEIAAATGLTLRYFWNSERATNRALEEIQQARQATKGPETFVRTEQQLLNNSGLLKRFGRSVRMGFFEEVDAQSQEIRARILKMYSEALPNFAETFGGQVNGAAFLAWLQADGILPADLELITELGTLLDPNATPVPKEGESIQEADPDPSALNQKSLELQYDEVSMNLDGRILEKRSHVFTVERAILELIHREKSFEPEAPEPPEPSFENALKEARDKMAAQFFSRHTPAQIKIWSKEINIPEDRLLQLSEETLTDEDYRLISAINFHESDLFSASLEPDGVG